MGLYISQNSKGESIGTAFITKVEKLIEDGAKKIDPPTEWRENLVCVVDNVMFAAAGYAYDEMEMDVFLDVFDRNTQWLEYEHAKQLAK